MEEISHPKRYVKGGLECYDVIMAMISNLPANEACDLYQIVKYIWRYPDKNGSHDLNKAKWHLEKLIEKVELKEGATYAERTV